jgi:hypothetical protein
MSKRRGVVTKRRVVMKRWNVVIVAVAAVAFGLTLSSVSSAQETPGPQAKGKGKKGKAKGPSMPAPRNKDGRVTLGPAAGQNGFLGRRRVDYRTRWRQPSDEPDAG